MACAPLFFPLDCFFLSRSINYEKLKIFAATNIKENTWSLKRTPSRSVLAYPHEGTKVDFLGSSSTAPDKCYTLVTTGDRMKKEVGGSPEVIWLP